MMEKENPSFLNPNEFLETSSQHTLRVSSVRLVTVLNFLVCIRIRNIGESQGCLHYICDNANLKEKDKSNSMTLVCFYYRRLRDDCVEILKSYMKEGLGHATHFL